MLILTKSDIQECFSMKDAIAAAKDAVRLYSSGNATVPLRTNLDVVDYHGQSLYMPAVTRGEQNALGVKIVSVYPENIEKGLPSVPATMVTLDPETGIVSAVLDGTYLTQLRTAAIQGAGTEELANPDAKIAGLIGTGGQGYQQAIAMMTARHLEELRVFDIDFQRALSFAEQLSKDVADTFATKIYAVETAKEAVTDADVITTVTTSKVNTFDAADVKKGAHINGIGAYTPEMLELPAELLVKANAVVFDTNDGVLAEAGDILEPIKKGLLTKEDYTGELGDLLLGNIHGRQNKEDITVFKSVGSAVLDIVTAQIIVEKAIKNGIGTQIDF
ncbi:ornithine cyclodeaminase [Streptococcus gallinaceus]|uniref:ornithine cyclodeaminase family protein n=1 Tax=Streptococcus gallinaceus TaxID=165758 RepID=UPI00209E0046|nr:ornithine cyclodeaminase family protein [Streptococcus gallinaceus]MCP1638919.1 ornithine cyclodeaminase [Streptococcus gallinaceus]MCP1769837.1 ornithine cyclodeaminase [Streptococcus gallinaceus]